MNNINYLKYNFFGQFCAVFNNKLLSHLIVWYNVPIIKPLIMDGLVIRGRFLVGRIYFILILFSYKPKNGIYCIHQQVVAVTLTQAEARIRI